jgi:hypothetical protein
VGCNSCISILIQFVRQSYTSFGFCILEICVVKRPSQMFSVVQLLLWPDVIGLLL